MRDGITSYEYQVLTNTWDGPGGAALWQAWEFCKEGGLIAATNLDGTVVPSERGTKAIKEYQAEETRKKSEAH